MTPTREQRVPLALSYYTDTLGLTVTPIHVPVAPGSCSCGKEYRFTPEGVPDKTDPEMCSSPGKHPVKTGFASDPRVQATTGEEARALFSSTAKEIWPNLEEITPFNIGIITGKGTGLVVVDVDVRADGLQSMMLLEQNLEKVSAPWRLGNTFSYLTSGSEKSRGYHLYFRADPDDSELWKALRILGENIMPGVELKWKRGMCVAAPSLHASGAVYELQPDTRPIADLTLDMLGNLHAALLIARGGTVPNAETTGAPTSMRDLLSTSSGSSVNRSWVDSAHDAPEGDVDSFAHSNHGRWVREVEYLFMTGSPIRTYGPGNHERTLKPLFGAAVNLFPPPDDIAEDIRAKMSESATWLPPFYGNMFELIDVAVTKPHPWCVPGTEGSDLNNFIGLGRSALLRQIDKQLSHLEWAKARRPQTN